MYQKVVSFDLRTALSENIDECFIKKNLVYLEINIHFPLEIVSHNFAELFHIITK